MPADIIHEKNFSQFLCTKMEDDIKKMSQKESLRSTKKVQLIVKNTKRWKRKWTKWKKSQWRHI